MPDLFPQGLPALTGATKATWPDLRQQLEQVRQDGFAFSGAESEPALNGLAVPVRDHTGEVVAAVAIAAPHFRLPMHTARVKAKILRDTAIGITRALGGG